MAAGDDADRDLYFDETTGTWDLDGLRSDLAVYLPEPAAAGSAAPRFQSPPPPLAANFAAAAVAPPPQCTSPPSAMAAAPAPPLHSPTPPAPPAALTAAAAPTPPPPVAAAPPFQSPEPTFEQMMSAATPLNAPGQNAQLSAQPSSPPFGSGAPTLVRVRVTVRARARVRVRARVRASVRVSAYPNPNPKPCKARRPPLETRRPRGRLWARGCARQPRAAPRPRHTALLPRSRRRRGQQRARAGWSAWWSTASRRPS